MNPNPFAGAARVGWTELSSHLRSPRLLVIALLFTLLIIGVSYGLAQPPQSPLGNQVQFYTHPAILNETGIVHFLGLAFVADADGVPMQGELVTLYEILYHPSSPPTTRLVGEAPTNASGFASFDLGTTFPLPQAGYDFKVENQGLESQLSFSLDLWNRTFTDTIGQAGLSNPFGSRYVVYGHILSISGAPAFGADLYLDDVLAGHPDVYGYFRFEIPPGTHTLRISFQGQEESYPVANNPTSGPTYMNGADSVLISLASAVMPLFLPIVAIAVSFDAIARERAQGTLEMLLCRGVTRPGVLLGKFLGAFGALALPVVTVIFAGVATVALASGRTPTPMFALSFILASLFLAAFYILLMLLLSTLAKNVVTAVVSGVAVWISFYLLFSFLMLLLLTVTGVNPVMRSYHRTLALVSLLNPNDLFQMLVMLGFPLPLTGSVGTVQIGYLAPPLLVFAAAVWVLGLLGSAMWIFLRNAEA